MGLTATRLFVPFGPGPRDPASPEDTALCSIIPALETRASICSPACKMCHFHHPPNDVEPCPGMKTSRTRPFAEHRGQLLETAAKTSQCHPGVRLPNSTRVVCELTQTGRKFSGGSNRKTLFSLPSLGSPRGIFVVLIAEKRFWKAKTLKQNNRFLSKSGNFMFWIGICLSAHSV